MSAGVSLRARRRPTLALPRDTEATAFTTILSELIRRIPGARAAALVDTDGEAVDYAGELSPFDVKIAGAHLQIVLGELRRLPHLARLRQVVVRGGAKSFIVRALEDAYAVVVVLSQRAGFASTSRAFTVFERALLAEAGIGAPPPGPVWTPVMVEQDARARPQTLCSAAGNAPHGVEVLGAVMGLLPGERGFRVRLAGGFETTLVREPGGAWYTEEPLDQGAVGSARR
jgi:predicted regulator of Ras-like GTPase activity (Roadblock/LC7/MglB family)